MRRLALIAALCASVPSPGRAACEARPVRKLHYLDRPEPLTAKITYYDFNFVVDAVAAITPQMCGAVGDGVSDDTGAVQEALNALPLNTANAPFYSPSTGVNGGTLVFPRGSYKITAPLVVHRGVRIVGEGPEAARILSYSASGVFKYQAPNGGGYTPDVIEIRGLSIWQQASVPATSGAGIEILPATTTYRAVTLRASDLIIEGTYYGITFANGIASSIRDSLITKTVRHGLYLYDPPAWRGGYLYPVGLRVASNGNTYEVITQGYSTNSADPADGPSGTGSDITDNTCHWKYLGAKPAVDVSTSTVVERVYSYLSQTGDGFHFENPEYSSLVGCAADSNAGWGYVLNGGTSTSILGAGAEQNGRGGMMLYGSSGTTVTGFRVVEGAQRIGYAPSNPLDQSTWVHGIDLWYPSRSTILGSTFTGTDETIGYGVHVVTTGPWIGAGNIFAGTYYTVQTETNGLSLTPGTGAASKFVGGDAGRYGIGVDTPDYAATLLLGGSQPLRLAPATTGPVISSGTATPTAGVWSVGSLILNTAAAGSGVAGWICTTAGTGTAAKWSPIALGAEIP